MIIVPRIGDEPRFLSRTSNSMSNPDASVRLRAHRRRQEGSRHDRCRAPIRKHGTLAPGRRAARDGGCDHRAIGRTVPPQGRKISACEVNSRKDFSRQTYKMGHPNRCSTFFKLVHRIAPTKTTVLVLGESGVGKELIANAIHYGSPMAGGPFVQVQLRISSREHRRKRAVRARERCLHRRVGAGERKGRFELASGGTISSTRWASCRYPFRPSFCASCRSARSSAWGGWAELNRNLRIIAATDGDLP